MTPWALGSTSPLCRLCRLGIYSVTQHFPLCTNCLWWVILIPFYLWSFIYICLCRSYVEKKRHEIQVFNYFSLHWCGAWGDTWGKLALRAGGRRDIQHLTDKTWSLRRFTDVTQMVQIEVNRAVAQNLRRLLFNCCDCWTIYKWWTVRQKRSTISATKSRFLLCLQPASDHLQNLMEVNFYWATLS